MSKLAIDGGTPVRQTPMPRRNLFGQEEKAAATALFDLSIESGDAFGYNGPEEEAYCAEFAAFLGGGFADMVSSGTVAEDLKGFLRDQWQRVRGAADLSRLLRRDGTGSARAIYANMLALLAAANRPRRPEQTPYELVPVAEEVLPTHQAEIAAITEAYVRVRYGEVTINADELAQLQKAWERMKADSPEQTHRNKNAPG